VELLGLQSWFIIRPFPLFDKLTVMVSAGGSTGDKQTSKGLFICCSLNSSQEEFERFRFSELFSFPNHGKLRDEQLFDKN